MSLAGYESFPFTAEDKTYTVHTRGSGPGVVIMHEVPGLTPDVQMFCDRVADAGFRVFVPEMFGSTGKPFSLPYAAQQIARACISREFAVLAKNASSPIVDWLKHLCRHAHAECGGPGVGAIGMCLTGNFALALMVDEFVLAPVLSQPSLPFGVSAAHKRALHVSDADLEIAKRRGCPLLGLRFTSDPMCPGERFERLRGEFGSNFEGIEIDSSKGNAHGIGAIAHSVVTKDLVDREGHPTREALDAVLGLFRTQLKPAN